MEAQSEHQIIPDQTRLLTIMDLERDNLKISFSHPYEMIVGSSRSFKTVNLTVDTKKIPLIDKFNLHMKNGLLIVNDLNKTSATTYKVENMLGKVIK